MSIFRIGRTYKNLKRLGEIANVLAKHGFGYLIHRLNLRHLLHLRRRVFKNEEPYLVEQEIKKACEELGPTFIKFGQLLSLRSDVLPAKLTNELAKLQDQVKPFPFAEVKKILEAEYKNKTEEIFSHIEEKPLASASMAQVHLAALKGTKEKLIIKVQRPGIEKEVERDLDILYFLANRIEKLVPEFKVYNPVGIVDEFSKAIRKELDFTYEVSNADRFRKAFKNNKTVLIPKINFDYSGRRVIAMEFVEGIKISRFLRSNRSAEEKKQVASSITSIYYSMIFEQGFFHADPHPGNILIMKDGKVGLVDFGMTGRLDEQMLKRLAFILLSFSDEDFVLEKYIHTGLISEYEENPEFQKEAMLLLERYKGFPLEKIDIGSALSELAELARSYGVKFEKDLTLLAKTLYTVERIIRDMVPDFDFVTATKPFARKYIGEKISAGKVIRELEKNITAFYSLIRALPNEILNIAKLIRKGTLKIEFEHVGLETLINEIDRSSNRLSFAVIIASVVVGSALVVHSGKSPFFGIGGFIVAGLLGLWLGVSILRSGKL
ncbi:MAG: AarF/ABC1/UbiB kinase family protein [Candidatus Firestonebacteria bacterium]